MKLPEPLNDGTSYASGWNACLKTIQESLSPAEDAGPRDTLLVDEERFRALLVEWAEKAHPEAEDEEGGVSELVADAIAAVRARPPASGPTPTPVIAATEDHPAIYRDGHRLTATPPLPPSSSLGAATADGARYGFCSGCHDPRTAEDFAASLTHCRRCR